MIEGELRSYERVHNAVRGVELVFHQGALPSVPRSVQDPLTTSAVTIEGTLNVLLAARDEDVRRVVFASSSSVYGNGGTLPRTEIAAARPDLALRRREAGGRALLRQLRPRLRARDGRAALLQRLRAAPGPELAVRGRRAAASSTPSSDGRPVPIHGDGSQSRDFTYVANVVEANLLAATRDGRRRQGAQRRHRPAGDASTSSPTRSAPFSASRSRRSTCRLRTGDVRDSWADVSPGGGVLGYEISVELEEGLDALPRRCCSRAGLHPRRRQRDPRAVGRERSDPHRGDRARDQHHARPRRRHGLPLRRDVPERDPAGRRAEDHAESDVDS